MGQSTSKPVTYTPMSKPTPEKACHPLVSEPVKIDDNNASLVLVFTKGEHIADGENVGGVLDLEEEVPNAAELARSLFVKSPEEEFTGVATHQKTEIDKFMEGFEDGMSMRDYQTLVRRKVVDCLKTAGLLVETFESVDGDEIFVKVALPSDGETTKALAERFQYTLPFKADAYRKTEAYGSMKGGNPPQNRYKDAVPAYAAVTKTLDGRLEKFSNIDLARIVRIRVNIDFNLDDMVTQKVLSRYFTGACYNDMQHLSESWTPNSKNKLRIFAIPRNRYDDEIRNYFGEQVAYVFVFMSRFVDALFPVGILALICACRRFSDDVLLQRQVQMGFGLVMLLWSFGFDKWFRQTAARLNQKWGMEEYEASMFLEAERPEFKRELLGSWKLSFQYVFAQATTFLFVVSFIVIFGLLGDMRQKPEYHSFLKKYMPIITSMLIKVWGVGWGFIAPMLAALQNPRTQLDFDHNLAWSLGPVKIFLALWPFLQIAFFNKWTQLHCEGSLAGAIAKAYVGQEDRNVSGVSDEMIAEHFSVVYTNETCVYGCFPVKCVEGGGCVTNCTELLETSLATFFIVHAMCTIIFLAIPIVLVKYQINAEVSKAMKQDDSGSDSEEAALDGGGSKDYSFLQVQAKCHESAPYEYKSWGGSYVEDFLELAIAYALVTCFGLALPIMVFFAFVCGVVEYRLMAYRMTNVTCRPHPTAASGIQAWGGIISGISYFAVVCNVMYAVTVMYPMRNWPTVTEFQMFIIGEHVAILLKVGIQGIIPDQAWDVVAIKDFNSYFLRTSRKHDRLQVPAKEQSKGLNYDSLKLD